ncbi:MAG: 50S ribosomal protein L25 [Chloroflexi bacterium]|nr:50S ribosomal protein L25 [Chloroflexota bacterium]
MSSSRPTLAAETREVLGKKVAHLRRAGRLPAVVFGHGKQSVPVTVDAHEFELLRRRIAGSTLVDLSVDGKKAHPVFIHDVQISPVTRRMLHAELFLVRMTEETTMDIPLVMVGEAPAVKDHGGTLLHALEMLKVRALPANLPERFEVSVDGLVDFDTQIHVRDIAIPSDVTLLTDPDEMVARVQAPRVEAAEAAAEGEAAEGEAAEGDATEAGSAEA